MVHLILPKPFKAILMLKRIEKHNKRASERPHLFLQQEVVSWEPYNGSNIRIYLENECCEIKICMNAYISKSQFLKRVSHDALKSDKD